MRKPATRQSEPTVSSLPKAGGRPHMPNDAFAHAHTRLFPPRNSPVDNASAARYPGIIVRATTSQGGVSESGGHVFVAKTPEAFVHDDDGNLLSDRLWAMIGLARSGSSASRRISVWWTRWPGMEAHRSGLVGRMW